MNFTRKLLFILVVSLALILPFATVSYIYHRRPRTLQEAGPRAQKMYCESHCAPSYNQCVNQCRRDILKAGGP